jgi:hypothetical protein
MHGTTVKKKNGMTGSVATVGEKREVHTKFCYENQKDGNHSGNLLVNDVVILKYILKKYSARLWTELMWL